MFDIKKIVVPTDFSGNAAKAYNIAHKLASHFAATVDFVHIIQTLDHYNKSLARLDVR